MLVRVTPCRRFVAVALMILASTSAARADERADALAVEAARTLFTEGTTHFSAGRWPAALTALERSYALVPSPNTMLMIARSLRELGRTAEAAAAYERAALEAAQRVAKGDAKYSPTERAATDEGRKVRATLGSVKVRVTRYEGVAVSIDGRPLVLDPGGAATSLHAPGSATVIVREPSGAEQKQTVTVHAGSTVEMEFSGDTPRVTAPLPEAPRPAPRAALVDVVPPVEGSPRAWAVPAAIGSGVMTLAGTAVFIGFGSASHATFTRLSAECGPSSCGPAERDDADAAKRQQTIANVGLAFASVAAAATIVFVVVALASPGRS
jgi:hypothetical protein